MEPYLKITAFLLLLLVHLAALQQTTDSPGRTLDKGWLREKPGKPVNTTDEEEYASTMDSSSEVTSGFAVVNEVELVNNTTLERLPDPGIAANTTVSTTTASVPVNTSLTNVTTEVNSTAAPPTAATDPMTTNSTKRPALNSTTVAPQTNATREATTTLSGGTEWNATSAGTPGPNVTSAATSSSTPLPLEPKEANPATTASTAVNTPAKANKTDKDALGERGLAPDAPRRQRYAQWAAVLGTMLAVTVVGLVAYVVLKRRRHKGFSHRKLVEEYPSDPVLRLDNSEPLDLNFGGSAYYNTGLQGDNIQMTNFPGRH